MSMEDEYEAISLCQQGDISGLEPLVNCYQLPALRMAYLLTGNLSLAEDIVQDSFLLAYQAAKQFQNGRPFAPWFYRIVTNLVRQRQREARRHASFSLDRLINSGTLDTEMQRDNHRMPGDPFEYAEQAEEHRSILRALNELTSKQREAIILRYYCGFNEQEMAKILQCLPGTVKWRLHVGLHALERIIRKKYPWLIEIDHVDTYSSTAQALMFTREDSSHV